MGLVIWVPVTFVGFAMNDFCGMRIVWLFPRTCLVCFVHVCCLEFVLFEFRFAVWACCCCLGGLLFVLSCLLVVDCLLLCIG